MAFESDEHRRQYHRDYYQKNLEHLRDLRRKTAQRDRERNKRVADAARDAPCADCGDCFESGVMNFHPTLNIRNQSLKKLREQIAGSEVLCANCRIARKAAAP